MAFKKLIHQLHLWLGLASGIVVFIVGITGALYAFIDELKPLVYHDRLYVQPQTGPKLEIDSLLSVAQTALGEKYKISRAELPAAADRSYSFRAVKINPDALFHNGYYQYYYKAYIDPYTAKVLYIENTKYEFFQIVVSLHMRLLFGERVGHYLVGYSVAIFLFLLLSGIVLWWPKKWNNAGRQKSFRIKLGAKFKRINYDLHNVLGFYSFLLLFVIALTGLIWTFPAVENGVRFLANGARNLNPVPAAVSDSSAVAEGKPINSIFKSVQAMHPDAYSYTINFPSKKSAPVNVLSYLSAKNKYDRTLYEFDRNSARLLAIRSFADLNGGDKIKQLNFDLHVGSVLSLPGKILAFFASLIAASLPVTGFYIWWGRKNKKPKVRPPRQLTADVNV